MTPASPDPTSRSLPDRRNAVLLAGGPGAGKSAVSQGLRDRGNRSIDLDYGFARWEGRNGEPVAFPGAPSLSWLAEHYWRWRVDLLDAALEDCGRDTVVFAGAAANMFPYLDRFDRLLLLRMDDATREARLVDPGRNNVFGKVGETATWSRWWHRKVESELTQRGARVIDSRQPLPTVVDQVIAACT